MDGRKAVGRAERTKELLLIETVSDHYIVPKLIMKLKEEGKDTV